MRAACVLVGLLVALPLAAAQGSVTLRFTATDDGFLVGGYNGLNPTLEISPGAHVELRLANAASGAHNIRFGSPVDRASPCCLRPGQEGVFEFDVPADANAETTYDSTMDPERLRGVLRIVEPTPRIRLVTPTEGADVAGAAGVTVEVSAFTLEAYPTTLPNLDRHGHVRYLLDGQPAFGPTDATAHDLDLVTPGAHLVRAELVGRDGAPLQPAVFDEVLVHRLRDIAEPGTPPPPTAPTPGFGAWALLLAIAPALALARARARVSA